MQIGNYEIKVDIHKYFLCNGITIYMDYLGKLQVEAGKNVSDSMIYDYIKKEEKFILKEWKDYRYANLPTFKNQTRVTLLGKTYTVYRSNRITKPILGNKGIGLPEKFDYYPLKHFLTDILYKAILIITKDYEKKYGFEYREVWVKESFSFWGRCRNRRAVIEYNLALIFTSYEFLEYIVVHELCHIWHNGHQKDFWDEVERIMPDAKKRRKEIHRVHIDWLLENIGIRKRQRR